jgi:hypothetical protein
MIKTPPRKISRQEKICRLSAIEARIPGSDMDTLLKKAQATIDALKTEPKSAEESICEMQKILAAIKTRPLCE